MLTTGQNAIAGYKGKIVVLKFWGTYNVKGTPTYYLLDRDGKIAAKNLPSFKRLNSAIDAILKQP